MSYPNSSTALARIVVDELTRGGMRLMVAAPGSRSTALALAAADHPDLELVVALDERSAAFHALGRAKANREPAAVLTTSGTAVANLMPAVVEADLSEAALIALTSDRPPELLGVGANQAIDQSRIFGGFVRSSIDLGPAEDHPSAPRWWRSIVSRTLAGALGFGHRPGPVHLNVAFREPTVPVSDDGRSREAPYPHDEPGRSDGGPWTRAVPSRSPDPAAIDEIVEAVTAAEKGIIVAGGGIGDAQSVVRLGEKLAWPVLATGESGLRGVEGALATGHHLVGRHRPDLVIRFGSPGPSRRMVDLVSGSAPQIVVASSWSDPGRTAQMIVAADAGAVASAVIEAVASRTGGDWSRWWREADRAVTSVLQPELVASMTEPSVAAGVGRMGAGVLTVASSMPIRDVESYAFSPPPIVANRGASGIDGFVSTALGAATGKDRPLALGGDLSLIHDGNGFICDPRPPCVFVVVDNGGGGIFSFLPQAEHAGEQFERLFAAPHGRDLAHLAAFHEVQLRRVGSLSELEEEVAAGWEREDCSLIVVTTDRADNVAEHLRLAQVVDAALADVPPPDDD